MPRPSALHIVGTKYLWEKIHIYFEFVLTILTGSYEVAIVGREIR